MTALRAAKGPLAITLATLLIACCLAAGWTRTEADFPSYYTAARMLRQGQALVHFYDMPYFQAQMDLNGAGERLGGYIPQTPVAMLPFVPLSALSMRAAKRVWLVADVLFLAAAVWLLAQASKQRVWIVAALLLCAAGSVYVNFLLGQYYVLLLFLTAFAVYCLDRARNTSAGFLFGLVCGLKLFTAPLCFYFAVKKQWRTLLGMALAMGILSFIALALFGWSDLRNYAANILPRSLAGETLDPFNPANGTVTTLLRRLFVGEAELNPKPFANLPGLFFFLRTLTLLLILYVSLAAFGGRRCVAAHIAGFLIGILLLAPNTASYTFLLLLVPVSLLFSEASHRERVALVSVYFLLALPMRPAWNWFFPKVALMLTLWLIATVRHGQPMSRPAFARGLSAAVLIASSVAAVSLVGYENRTDQRWHRIALRRGSIYSSAPTPTADGLFYQTIADGQYRLQYVGSRRPTADDKPPSSKQDGSLRSPDGKWNAFSRVTGVGVSQVFLCRSGGAAPVQVTHGWCNSFAPAWEPDSSAIVLASDCGRGVGMPALYRVPLKQVEGMNE